ncbi:MAG: type restriction enzyme protein, partial [Blastocatellia bacterium]|nr:type restriction enzyme protein [Blastocatellia bacterium]
MSNPNGLVKKLWNYCAILRDDGLSYGDYVEQLTFLLFLKMADEQSRPPFNKVNKSSPIPKEFSWATLLKMDGDDLEVHYRHTLEELGKRSGMLGVIFRKAQNKIQDPAKLRRLIVDLIDKEEWSSLDADVKGDAYEGLLQKNAEDVKGGAGQYFTPRPLIAANSSRVERVEAVEFRIALEQRQIRIASRPIGVAEPGGARLAQGVERFRL